MGGPVSSTTAQIYMQASAITMALHRPKVWEGFVDDVYSIIKRMHLEIFFHHINNLHQNIKFTMKEESNGELAFLDTLLKQNNGEISVLVYRKPTHTDQYLNYSSHHQTSCNVLLPPCLVENIPLSHIKMTYTKKTLASVKGE